jgi:hypothetical protein
LPKQIDAAVLQEAADHRLAHADILGQARHARPQAADAAHHQVDLHAGLAGGVERIDHRRIDQTVHLRPDRRRLARLGMLDLVGM